MNYSIYEIYKARRKLVEKIELDDQLDYDDDKKDLYLGWKETIEILNLSNSGYAEQYEREKKIIASFTPEQIDHICYQIGDWYLLMKTLLEGQHNLGYMKEILKEMICGN